jgi:hypothetical protein
MSLFSSRLLGPDPLFFLIRSIGSFADLLPVSADGARRPAHVINVSIDRRPNGIRSEFLPVAISEKINNMLAQRKNTSTFAPFVSRVEHFATVQFLTESTK